MNTAVGMSQSSLGRRLEEVRRLCPNLRFGQFLATVGMLGEDSTGRSLGDIDDEEFTAALERFASDLSRRNPQE
jgi:hypothetical protein